MLFAPFLKDDYPYNVAQVKAMVPIRHLGLTEDHYGGKLYSYAAELKNGMYIIIDKELNTIDIALNPEKLNLIDMDILKKIAKAKKIEFDWRKITKDELIQLFQAA